MHHTESERNMKSIMNSAYDIIHDRSRAIDCRTDAKTDGKKDREKNRPADNRKRRLRRTEEHTDKQKDNQTENEINEQTETHLDGRKTRKDGQTD